MRNLSFASIAVALLVAGCTSIRPPGMKKCAKEAQPVSFDQSPYLGRVEKMLFKASMTIRTQRLTGLMLFKTMPDSTIQIVFTNEIGMTFFNFSMKNGSFEKVYCFGPMDKKAIIPLFRTCFELMLKYKCEEKGRMFLCDPVKGNTVTGGRYGKYYTWSGISGEDPRAAFINGMSNLSDKTMITFSDFSSDIPKSVNILNPFINLKIHLDMISF